MLRNDQYVDTPWGDRLAREELVHEAVAARFKTTTDDQDVILSLPRELARGRRRELSMDATLAFSQFAVQFCKAKTLRI